MIPTPCCVPWTYIWSNITGVFSKTNLPSINITASLGGISASFITLISLVLPVLLYVLFWINVTFGYVTPIPTLETCVYNNNADVPVGTSYNFCRPGETGTAIDTNLLTGAIAILSQC